MIPKDEVIVLMSTYNGQEHIHEQLNSLVNQTVKPDKVIITDDASTDQTPTIIHDFIIKNKLEETWFLSSKSENQGWRKRFNNMLKTVSAKYIFLCDQDDIWRIDKIEIMLREIESRKYIDVLASNFSCFSSSNEISTNLSMCDGDVRVEKISFDFINDIANPGCSYLLRGEYVTTLYSLVNDEALNAHDALLWTVSCAKGTLFKLNVTTLDWRRHESSATHNNNHFKGRDDTILNHKRTISRMSLALLFVSIERERVYINNYLFFISSRLKSITERNLFKLIYIHLRNIPFNKGKRDVYNDFISLF